MCRANIRHFAHAGATQPVFIHPHPEVYHYDLMTHFGADIFFISFRPDALIKALRDNASLGQRLYLLKDDSALIELSAEGSRLVMKRPIHLSADELRAVLVRLPIEGTAWRLVALSDAALLERERRDLLASFLIRSAGTLGLTFILLRLLRAESTRRRRAENEAYVMTQLSNTDALSGLPNRRAIDPALAREWQAMKRSGEPLTLMMVDIDYFKLYNDHLGHPQGDIAIRAVAEALRAVATRPRDLVGRFGGEEFLLILPDTPAQACAFMAQSMHDAVREAALPHPCSPVSDLFTISIGVVSATPYSSASAETLLALADQALYAAKQAGRNGTANAEQIMPAAAS